MLENLGAIRMLGGDHGREEAPLHLMVLRGVSLERIRVW